MSELFDFQYSGEFVGGKMESDEVCEYRFSSGTVYRGRMKNGCFHGEGLLIFPGKGSYKARWVKGELQMDEGEYTFEDGLKLEDDGEWDYCTEKDRRYFEEKVEGIAPAGAAQIRNKYREGKPVPRDVYDVLDGVFDPKTGQVKEYDSGACVRAPNEAEVDVITKRAYKGF